MHYRRSFLNLLAAAFMVAVAAFTLQLQGCAVTSTAFNDKAAEASVSLQWATSEATKLAAAGTITRAQLTSAIDASKAGTLALDTAKTLQAAGKAADAETQLGMAITILNSVKTFLLAYGVKP